MAKTNAKVNDAAEQETPAQTENAITAVKAITLKQLSGGIPAGGGEFIGKVIAAVAGKVNGYSIKNTQYGESILLQGSFIAVSLITKETYEAPGLYLPKDYAEMIANSLDKSEAGSEILLDKLQIFCAKSDRSGRGYTFITKSLETPQVVNEKKQLAASLLGDVQLLLK